MKKLSLFSFLLYFSINAIYAQSFFPDEPQYLIAGSGVGNRNVPPDPSIFAPNKTETVSVNVNFIGNWTSNQKSAFNYAVNIIENTFTSDVTIEIDAEWDNFSNTFLGRAYALSTISSSSFSSTHPAYMSNTRYAIALANKLSDGGTDLAQSISDVQVDLNSYYKDDFYYGVDRNCPGDKYDFVSVVLHEIIHGLGFSKSARESSGQLIYMFGGEPYIYDRFLVDGDGVNLTSLTNPSPELTSFLTSDDVFWADNTNATFANGGIPVKIYAPTTWESGSSLSHVDVSSVPDALMIKGLDPGEAIHYPSLVEIGMLKDIGWSATLYTGVEDELRFFSIQNYSGSRPNNPNNITIGEEYYFTTDFIDNYPYGDYISTISFKLEVFHDEGIHTHKVGGNGSWITSFNDLPTGYNWERLITGKVKARIVAYGTDNDGTYHEAILPISINYKPNTIYSDVKNIGILKTQKCANVELSFYAEGATNYTVYYKQVDDFSWMQIPVPTGNLTYQLSGLDYDKDYEFIVEGSNSYGYRSSEVFQRKKCGLTLVVFPNPTVGIIKVNSDDINTSISDVSVIKIDQPNISKSEQGSLTNESEINVDDMPDGTYIIKVTDSDGVESSKTFIKY